MRRRFSTALLLAGALVLAACGDSGSDAAPAASSAAETYPEQDVSFLVGTSAGGGFDAWARALAPPLEEALPGEGGVVVTNQTGAGGLVAANALVGGDNEHTILITNTLGLAASQVTDALAFDMRELTWLGRLSAEPLAVFVNPDSGFDSIEDLQAAPDTLRGAVTGLSASTGIGAILLGGAYDLDWRPVTHEGGTEASVSVVRGDSDFLVDSIVSRRGELAAGDLKPILSLTTERPEALPGDVPLSDDADLVEASNFARDVAGPPGMPAEAVTALREAITEVLGDQAFASSMEDAGFDVVHVPGEELDGQIDELVASYEGYSELLNTALSGS